MIAFSKKYQSLFAIFFGTISFLYFSYRIWFDYSLGGNSWKQGDWLINSQGGAVRRSLSGDFFIWLADLSGAELLFVAVAAQITIAAALYFCILRLIVNEKAGVLFLLALSPSFFLFFWMADPQGAARKEIIAFLAMAIMLMSINAKNTISLSVGFFIFFVAVSSHEAMILFLPVILYGYLFLSDAKSRTASMHFVVMVSALASVFAFFTALFNSAPPDTSAICDALLSRGIAPELCLGAIRWLNFDLSYGVQQVFDRNSVSSILQLVFGYGIALLPAVLIFMLSHQKRKIILIIACSMLSFIPLYFFAVDYGRWISFHVFSIFFLFALGLQSGQISLKKPIPFQIQAVVFILGLFLTHAHTNYMIWGGSARRAASELLRLIG